MPDPTNPASPTPEDIANNMGDQQPINVTPTFYEIRVIIKKLHPDGDHPDLAHLRDDDWDDEESEQSKTIQVTEPLPYNCNILGELIRHIPNAFKQCGVTPISITPQ